MARRVTAEVLRRQKEAKQKKLLIALAPVFLGLVAWQGPPMYKALFSGSAPPPLPPVQTTAVPGDPTAGAPTPQQGGTTTTAAETGGLADTDPRPSAGIDRLVSFSRFTARDPFRITVGQTGTAIGTGTDDSGGAGQQAASALVEVNGASQSVSVGDSFPAGDPTFKLVSLTSEKAVLGLVSGTFEGGQETVEIAVGEQVQLVADDGATFTIKLVSVGS